MTTGRVERARRLRRDSQSAEHRLWQALRNRQLRGCKFRRQPPVLRYTADFACAERRLIVELDGYAHAERANHDAQRTRDLEAAGWRVIRFWNEQLDDDGLSFVLEDIAQALDEAAP